MNDEKTDKTVVSNSSVEGVVLHEGEQRSCSKGKEVGPGEIEVELSPELQVWLVSSEGALDGEEESEPVVTEVSTILKKTQKQLDAENEMLVIERDLLPSAKKELYWLTSPDYKAKDNPDHEHRKRDIEGLLSSISWLETRYLIALEVTIPF